ncbi:MAG TPA: serine/threonine-protein kinase, partial [Gemmataceae bacterium]|nr:serine/threonine-protein kinase [Gemmataceae bacterium]
MSATPDRNETDAEDPRLIRAAQEYLAELEAGRRPRRREFAARYPEIADALMPYLDALDLFQSASPRSAATTTGGRRPAADAPPAEPLGDFRIEREIGRGGMGVVYEAVQMSLGRRVALKVLPFAAALDAKQLQRFQNEAQAAAQLHHTNIVPVYSVGCERGVHYYAMQLIDGHNLADLIARMRPDETEAPAPAAATTGAAAALSTQRATRSSGFYRTAARLAAQAAEALEHAHQVGVIHRDVKPANLMVDVRGNLWVTDFGLAQFHNRAGLTRTGDLLGTLRYMSPEQAAGQGAPLDPRTDVYSLGATLYELLTLEPLFGGADHVRLLREILYDEPKPPRAIDRSIPPELETIVLKAVSKNPSERYATARDFADDL